MHESPELLPVKEKAPAPGSLANHTPMMQQYPSIDALFPK
jgi:hypothetical protein